MTFYIIGHFNIGGKCKVPGWSTMISEALLLKQMPKKQTGFVLVIKQNKPDLFFLIKN